MLNKDEILKTIQQNRAGLKKFGVKKLGLFGSYARTHIQAYITDWIFSRGPG